MNKILILIFVVFFTAGCSIKDVSAPIVKYKILNINHLNKQKQNGKILKISQFKTAKNLLGDKIWYSRALYKTNSYLYSSWNQNFSSMVEQNIANTLYKNGLFKSVFVSYSRVKYDLVLEGDIIKAVQNVTKDKANVTFEMRLYLIDAKSSKLLGTKEFVFEKKCESIDALGAVKAYNKVFKTFDKEVVLWLRKLTKEN
ncbi:MAG: ABC-type transport auxiliary lipoprotein family protein [Campylobacteraceae bacterium]|nr:ABC-type transport auxiliary lipoprotein family protein [Campylobacteraceae bacterium]